MARRSGPGRIDSSTGFATWVSCKNRGWRRKPPGIARLSRVNPRAAAIAAEPAGRTRSESDSRIPRRFERIAGLHLRKGSFGVGGDLVLAEVLFVRGNRPLVAEWIFRHAVTIAPELVG